MPTDTMTRREMRLQRIEEHVEFENAHDLDGILGTLAPEPVSEDRVASERIYYDRATVLSQVGLFRDPRTPLARILTPLRHPITITRALSRAFLRP